MNQQKLVRAFVVAYIILIAIAAILSCFGLTLRM